MKKSNKSKKELLQMLSLEKRQAFLKTLTPEQALALQYDLEFIGRPSQQIPKGDWDTWMILAGRGWGKALRLSTPIPTPTGWTTMADIQQGDIVFDENGNQTLVTDVHPIRYNDSIWSVQFSDGSEVVASGEHLWSVKTHNIRKNNIRKDCVNKPDHLEDIVRTTEELLPLLKYGKRGDNNLSIDIAQPLNLPEADLPIDPYIFGYWLGDGNSHECCITVDKKDSTNLLSRIDKAGLYHKQRKINKANPNVYQYTISNEHLNKPFKTLNPLSINGILNQLNTIKNKHIPMQYLRASFAQRLELLKGLMDSDGTISKDCNYCSFSNMNERLSDNLYELVVSLGMKSTRYKKKAYLNGKYIGIDHRVNFTPNINVFNLTRKSNRIRQNTKQRARHTHRMITAITQLPSEPVRCISVDSSSHLFLAGESMIPTHNSFVGSHTVINWAKNNPGCSIAIIGETSSDIRDTIVKGQSGILKQSHPEFMPTYIPSQRLLKWPNGSQALTYSSETPDQLRGPQFAFCLIDELAKFQYQDDVWDMLAFCMRLGTNPQIVITTTPRPTKLIKEIARDPATTLTTGSTFDNAANLPKAFLNKLEEKYSGTRLGKQEIFAKILDDNPNALFDLANFAEFRTSIKKMPNLRKIVVAVDPATTNNENSDETGIIVAGIDFHGHGYVLEDLSVHASPADWAAIAIKAYHKWQANCIVAETNQGGDMVQTIMHNEDANIAYEGVRATKGKAIRAEPVSALYAQGRIAHVGMFLELEDQMSDFDPSINQSSPDRLDALVWAFTKLFRFDIVEPHVWTL